MTTNFGQEEDLEELIHLRLDKQLLLASSRQDHMT